MSASPEPPEALPAGSADGLFTAQDLFGDLVDGPAEASPPRPARRGGPVKIQIAEKGGPHQPAAPQTIDLPPEEMAGLLDAFGPGLPEEEPPTPSPVAEPPRPEPSAVAAPASPIAAGKAEVDALLDNLSAIEEPAVEEPAAEVATTEPEVESPAPRAATQDEQEVGLFLDRLTEQVEEPARDVPVEEPALNEPAADAEDFGSLLGAISEAEPAPSLPSTKEAAPSAASAPLETAPAEPLTEEPVLEPPVEPPSVPAPMAEPAKAEPATELDQFLSGFLETAPPREASAPSTAPLGMRFQVVEPSVAAPKETRTVIDLAALADEALSLPLTRPGVAPPATATSTEASETGPPDAYGPYRLLERIAAGGMAEVFRAKRSGVEGFEKVVAVKRILPHLSDNKEFVEMFIDEAKMVAGLSHPNIVQIFDLGRIEKTYFIAMEHVHGKDLRTILKRAKEKGLRIPLDLTVLIISKVCSALEYAHRKKDEGGQPLRIVHRDISPQNILISFEGEVKLTDFGIAKATSKATDTDRGALRGKLLYMSPEQASGQPLDRRSDVFSLGVVFYEMITDVKPFLGTSEKGILEMVRECRVEAPRSLNARVTERLERVVMKALEKDPERRFADASEMYRDLERVLHERQPPAATELARFMDLLFEEGDAHSPASASSPGKREPQGEGAIEIDLGPENPAPTASATTEEPGKDPHGIGKLLRHFGIK